MPRRSFLDLGLKCLAATGSAQFWAQKALASIGRWLRSQQRHYS